jgi:TRAP-type C4-dicarboxylate transport system permease small subunit
MFFQVMTLIFFILLYREWKKLGGKHNYKPPAVEVKQPATA